MFLGLLVIILIAYLIIKGKKKKAAALLLQEEKERAERAERIAARQKFIELKLQETRSAVDSIPKYQIAVNAENKLRRNYLKNISEIKIKNVTKSFNIDLLPTYVVVDVETTGLSAGQDRIVELSAILYEDSVPTSCFSTLLNPLTKISEEATKINHITDEMVANAPTFPQIIDSFVDFLGDRPIVAYNAPFDLKFLYCSGLDLISDKRKIFDVLALMKKADKNYYSYKLESVANSLNIFYDAHSSLYDCYATGLVFQHALDLITSA